MSEKVFYLQLIHAYLKEPIERDPEKENVTKKLNKAENAVDHPVGQPFGIIILVMAFNGFHTKNK